jgi:hypothetical protein
MARSQTARWVMTLFLAWLLATACVMLYPFAVATASATGPHMAGATIGFLGLVVCAVVVFARVLTWPLRRQRPLRTGVGDRQDSGS